MVSVNNPGRKNRLIVMVPDCLAGNVELAHKIYWMAIRDQCDILYLTLVDDGEKMLSIARSMTTMKAVTSANSLVVNYKLTETAHWMKTLSEIYQPGDWIVCHEEQLVKDGFLKTSPIADFLYYKMKVPIITIGGFYHPQQIQISRWFHSFVVWLGFLLILAVFTVLEIQLERAFSGFPGKMLLSILVVIEIGAIWAWDSIYGQ